ncbi:unnamed protein product [Gongylonema pulchrum]|uniref:Transmembrane protein n=1 Tax=Gongylonema pulchrum TaxID=637853 RepID=A0A183D3P4_9BILA|nr:unnamed protein product [Gongylonema pulchrum]
MSKVKDGEVTPIDDLLIKVKLFAVGGALLPGAACYVCIVYTYVFQFQRIQNFTSSSCPNMHSNHSLVKLQLNASGLLTALTPVRVLALIIYRN